MFWLDRRIVQWSLLLVLALTLMAVFRQHFQAMRAQAELAAIKSTLGALRTALVIDHIKRAAPSEVAAVNAKEQNPFLLLEYPAANYAGLWSSTEHDFVPLGSWVYDPICRCIGYGPKFQTDPAIEGEALAVWFRISPPPGPLQIAPVQRYVWQGEVVE